MKFFFFHILQHTHSLCEDTGFPLSSSLNAAAGKAGEHQAIERPKRVWVERGQPRRGNASVESVDGWVLVPKATKRVRNRMETGADSNVPPNPNPRTLKDGTGINQPIDLRASQFMRVKSLRA